jgi:hypothetical protein
VSDYLDDAGFASDNNPAGRAIKCLAPALHNGSNTSIAGILGRTFGMETSDLAFPIMCAALRVEVYSVRSRIAPYLLTMRGARRSFEEFETVIAAADALLLPNSISELGLKQTISAKGWSALCWADEILSADSQEPVMDPDAAMDLLAKVRELMDEVLNSGEFTEEEKRHMVGLLQDLEAALAGVKISGSGPVERASKVVMGDVMTRPDIWSKDGGKERKSILARVATVAVGVITVLGAYSGTKELTLDLFPQLAIAAPSQAGPDTPVTGPVVDESEGPATRR